MLFNTCIDEAVALDRDHPLYSLLQQVKTVMLDVLAQSRAEKTKEKAEHDQRIEKTPKKSKKRALVADLELRERHFTE
jgi:hypothetical protein